MDINRKKLLRRFHALCAEAGVGAEEKLAIVRDCGVESSADIDARDLIDLCNRLARRAEPKAAGRDRLRKQAMAAIGGWLRVAGRESNAGIIKGIACRATGYENFNRIPAERLRNLYNTFLNKQRDKAAVDRITGGGRPEVAVVMLGAGGAAGNNIMN